MKKNTMMRIASVLLVAVLLSTCTISGTFAKYTTSANVGDTARVAKWGIVMDSTGNATFADHYETTNKTAYTGDNSVVGESNAVVVAPGTSNSVTYSVTGTPEVAYVVSFDGTATEDIFLKGGSKFAYADVQNVVAYTVPTNATGSTVSGNYYPVDYTVTIATAGTLAGGGFTAGTAQNFETLEAAMEALDAATVTFGPNAACDVVVTIGWTWAFSVDATTDAYDTVLGDLMARNADLSYTKSDDTEAVDGTDYNLDIAFDLIMTATQID